MSNRRRLRRERLEIYLVHLLLAYRYLIKTSGGLLLLFSAVVMFIDTLAGFFTLLPAIYLLLLGNSYHIVLNTARLGAWVGTLGRNDD